jgi:hypothetical protein
MSSQSAVGVPPNRLGEAPARDFHLRVDLHIPFAKADIHAGLTHVALTSTPRTGTKRSSGEPNKRSMQNTGYGLRRILFLRGWVNKGQKRKGRGALSSPGPPPVRLTASLPSYWTVNFQVLDWLPSMFGFWSSALPVKSCAPVVTVAL